MLYLVEIVELKRNHELTKTRPFLSFLNMYSEPAHEIWIWMKTRYTVLTTCQHGISVLLLIALTKKGTMDLQQHAHSCTPNIYQACYISSWAPYRVVTGDRKKQGLTSLPMSWYCLQNNQFITVWDLAFLVVKSIVKTLTIYHSLIIWKYLMACYGSLRLW